MIFRSSICLGLALSLCPPLTSAQVAPNLKGDSQMAIKIAHAGDLVRKFGQSGDLEDLQAAISGLTTMCLRDADASAASKADEVHFTKAEKPQVDLLWLNLLLSMKKATDANEATGKMVQRVSPGRDSDGVAYPPGVDPNKIKDPAVRNAYLEAIAKNKVLIEQSNSRLRILYKRKEVMSKFKTWAAGTYSKDPQGRQRVLSEASQFSLTEEEFDSLKTALRL